MKVKVAQLCLTLCHPKDCSPWNSPGQNTWVGSRFLLWESSQARDRTQVSLIAGGFFTSWATREVQCSRWRYPLSCYYLVLSHVWLFRDPMDWSLSGFSVWGIFQARILEWVVTSSSRESPRSRDWTCISLMAGKFFTTEPPGKHILKDSSAVK